MTTSGPVTTRQGCPPTLILVACVKNKTLRGSLIDKAALQAVRGWKWSPDSETVTFYARREPRGGHPHPYGTDGLGIGHGGTPDEALAGAVVGGPAGQSGGPRLGASPGPSVPDGSVFSHVMTDGCSPTMPGPGRAVSGLWPETERGRQRRARGGQRRAVATR